MYYNSEMRNKTTASVEVAHDHANGDAALKKTSSVKRHTMAKSSPIVRWKKGKGRKRTHDDAVADVGFPTICASKTLTNPSIAYFPAEATSPA